MTIQRPFTRAATSLALAALGFLAACAHTKFESVTKDPTFQPQAMRRLFVVAVLKRTHMEKMLEEEFVRSFATRQIEAAAAHSTLLEGAPLDETTWKQMLARQGFDAVLVARLVEKESVGEKDVKGKVIMSGTPGSYGYYSGTHVGLVDQGGAVGKTFAVVEARLFDVASERQVWSARSRSQVFEGGDPEPQVRRFVAQLMEALFKK